MVLKEVDLAQVRRSGEHFKKILRQVFEHIPRSAHSIAGMSRWTGINKSTCQRLVQALTKTKDGIDVVITLPGTGGLEQFYHKFQQLIADKECLKNFEQLVNEYQNLIFDYATSQSELKRRLLQSQVQGSASKDSYTKKLRKQAYDTNREISGESVDLYLGLHISRVSKTDINTLDEIVVANRVGIELLKNARPFVQAFGGNQEPLLLKEPRLINQLSLNEESTVKQSGEFLFTDFSTLGVEKCFAGVGELKNNLIYNHTLPPIDSRKFDITLGYFGARSQVNPMRKHPKIICQSLTERSPAKRLVLISIVSKTLDRACSVQAGCYPSSMKAQESGHHPEDMWSERFSDTPELKLFSPETGDLGANTGIAHIDALMKQAFDLIGDNPSDYVGYYLDVENPLWLTSHRIYFEFQ